MVIPFILHVAGILGKLISTPFLRSAHDTPQKCARQCLSYSNVKCLAFNYDYGTAGNCELLEEIQAQHVEIHQVNLNIRNTSPTCKNSSGKSKYKPNM